MNPNRTTGIKRILKVLGERFFTNIKTYTITLTTITTNNKIIEGMKYNKLVPFDNHENMSIALPQNAFYL